MRIFDWLYPIFLFHFLLYESFRVWNLKNVRLFVCLSKTLTSNVKESITSDKRASTFDSLSTLGKPSYARGHHFKIFLKIFSGLYFLLFNKNTLSSAAISDQIFTIFLLLLWFMLEIFMLSYGYFIFWRTAFMDELVYFMSKNVLNVFMRSLGELMTVR